ncbi:hypothetical protein [Sphingomonas sp. YR710]|uniref:hypothetical protein n=1 Tax=Sphingomonas sp. YR710 TaxID=1882773 RepID=UPI00210AC6DB|nr:hypothetical protein [Sphingomonas sp. YR710]
MIDDAAEIDCHPFEVIGGHTRIALRHDRFDCLARQPASLANRAIDHRDKIAVTACQIAVAKFEIDGVRLQTIIEQQLADLVKETAPFFAFGM